MMYLLIAGLVFWMLGCAYAGFHRRFGLFALVLVAGVTVNTAWMYFGLNAPPTSAPALMAHLAAVMYAVAAVAAGWLSGRLFRAFRESRVERQ